MNNTQVKNQQAYTTYKKNGVLYVKTKIGNVDIDAPAENVLDIVFGLGLLILGFAILSNIKNQ